MSKLPEIERGIKIPPINRRRVGRGLGKLSELMLSMKIGDSILLHKNKKALTRQAHRLFGKGNYSYRPEGDGWRVWRTGEANYSPSANRGAEISTKTED